MYVGESDLTTDDGRRTTDDEHPTITKVHIEHHAKVS